nr:hypothetical protein [Tanacetum cinerariifolium]
MAWNLGSRISALERAKTHIKSSMSSLQEDTSSIKSMMTEMYNSFRGQSSSAPSSSVAPTFAFTNIPSNNQRNQQMQTLSSLSYPLIHLQSLRHNPSQSSILNLLYHKERAKEEIKKAKVKGRLNAISKTEVIKVIREEAKKLGIHPKEAITTKAGELFKKAQDAEHEVLKRQHTKKEEQTEFHVP